ncbi:MAG: response regulator [Bacillota bacterium]|uniref:Response regulator n=1 Tax=Virgibacillus salarius TaxID=447199 RepID=A0A941IAR1_9BACI|nr:MULTISPECIES: response regulator [Bacillaceae]NAZ08329.1 response regulator [Agaribacter marinus]MBR7795616.1 response regulator [Virgibacillus salarius]MCC2251326.1 response regulator [Virgibacillus sp. AGTR]MDY7045674.1 response regulator [Virgibacillus sp. M23]QRZ18550.1 response regulator [Virgibacillus sp. AGTR]
MKKKILIVDDQPGICMLLTDILTNEGYHVETAKTGKEGLDKVTSSSFQLLMIDYKLPIYNAFEVIRLMNQTGVSTRTIVMSGITEEVIRENEDCSNVESVLTKPFNIQEVCDLVKSIIG